MYICVVGTTRQGAVVLVGNVSESVGDGGRVVLRDRVYGFGPVQVDGPEHSGGR